MQRKCLSLRTFRLNARNPSVDDARVARCRPKSAPISRRAWLLAVCLSAGIQQALLGQGNDATCRTCALDMVRVQKIPSANASVVVQSTPSIVFAQGAYVLAPTYGGTAAVFRNNSLEPVGKKGHGPGEFPDRPATMGLSSDGKVFAVHGNRVSTIDPVQRKVSHALTLPWAPGVYTQIGKESIAVDAGSTDVSVIDRSGKILRKNPTALKLKNNDILRLAASGDSAYWVGSLYTYTAYLTRLDGTVLRTVSRTPQWFQNRGAVAGEPLRARPAPAVRGFVEMGDGLLLFVLSVPDSEWRPGPARGTLLSKMRPDEYVDTVLEVVDSKDSKLITSSRYDQAVHLVRGSRYVWLLTQDEAGEEAFEIFHPRLRR